MGCDTVHLVLNLLVMVGIRGDYVVIELHMELYVRDDGKKSEVYNKQTNWHKFYGLHQWWHIFKVKEFQGFFQVSNAF